MAIRRQSVPATSCSFPGRSAVAPMEHFEQQVKVAFDNLKATLNAAGCTFDDLVDVTTFHTDPENQFGAVMAVKQSIFERPPYPNWTAVGVNWLAGFDFEIKVIARIPSTS
jgi:enamine deaminase RidA (YjgF/YER057c/UK114 family)